MIFIRSTDGGSVVTVPTPEIKQTEGGLQLRYKLPTGGKVSISEVEKDSFDKAHFHRGLTEIYTIHKGKILIATLIEGRHIILNELSDKDESNKNLEVYASVPHLVYKCNGSVFITQTVGNPIPNPERSGNDWFPASESFQREAKEIIVKEMID